MQRVRRTFEVSMESLLEELADRMDPKPEGEALVGLSGGADSVGLLMMLLPRVREGFLSLRAVHVNHGLRGTESEQDEAFCEALCRREGIPYRAVRLDLDGRRDENSARNARYAAFFDCMRADRVGQLLLAHHRDDQAETFLMRLMRGAGPEGLGCMKPAERRDGFLILRPMLGLSGGEIRKALREAGVSWREDASNAETFYLRNRIRHVLLPEMERILPGSAARIARTAKLIGEAQEADEVRTRGFLEKHAGKTWMDAEALSPLPHAEQSRILRAWWQENAPERKERALSFRQTGELTELIRGPYGSTANLPAGWRAQRGRHVIHLIPTGRKTEPAVPLKPDGAEWNGIRLAVLPGKDEPGDGLREQEIPVNWISDCAVRGRQDGDWIRPFGMAGRKSLQDYLTDRGIDAPWRDQIPLLCRGKEVLLAAGVGAGGIPAWNGNGNSVRLVWQGELPWERERSVNT